MRKKWNKSTVITSIMILGVCFALAGCANTQNEIIWKVSEQEEASQDVETADSEEKQTQEEIFVYVCGAIEVPGVYQVPQGSRLFEVIELAGGLTQEADSVYLNLARTVTDGEQIVILTTQEVMEQEAQLSEQASIEQQAALGLVNINTASVQELMTLSGIGESRALAIIAYRTEQGAFRSIEDIKKVTGIKDGLYSKIKDKITVG